jgi:pSer/pThr/pTyr-binding forkhead associated (FHA) protein
MDVKLVMFKTDGQRKDFPLISSRTVIGRGENCDLRVPLPSVSRQHCRLETEGDQVRLKDLGSSNGTYVNNRRVTEATISAGDRIVVGPIVFTAQIDGEPAQVRPVKTRGQVMAAEGDTGEDIIDLEDDVVAQPGASGLRESPAADLEEVAGEGGEEIDPISALEAMAQKEEDEEDKDEKEGS